VDYPAKTRMLDLDLPVLRRGGRVARVTAAGWEGRDQPPALSDQLYRSARWLRVFVGRDARARVAVPGDRVVEVLRRPARRLRAALAAGSAARVSRRLGYAPPRSRPRASASCAPPRGTKRRRRLALVLHRQAARSMA
jgi:hypothetical protein